MQLVVLCYGTLANECSQEFVKVLFITGILLWFLNETCTLKTKNIKFYVKITDLSTLLIFNASYYNEMSLTF